MYNIGVKIDVGSAYDGMTMNTSTNLNPLMKPLVLIVAHAAHKHGLRIPTFLIANFVLFHFQVSLALALV